MELEYFRTNAPFNVPIRYRHKECSPVGKSPALVVTRQSSGWVYNCHRCGWSGFRALSGEDPARIQRFIANANKRITTNSKLELPKDTGKSIPPEGLSWLYQYGLNDAEIEKYGIGWSEKYQRVILPVFQEDNLIFWQGRYLGSNKKIPKYLNQKLAKRNQDTFFDIRIAKNKEIVIVEDILSAIKVGRQYNVTALLHSTITDSIFLRVKNFNPIYVWLDPDKVFYTIDIINRMRLIGINAKRIMSEKDPKYYSDYDINKIISCNN